MEFDLQNHHRGNNFMRSSSLNMPHNYSSGDTMVASPLAHHWNPQPLCSSNVSGNSNNNGQRKRDFHFQVIQVQNQGPKWLFFPSQQTVDTNIKKNNSDQENENLRIRSNSNEQEPSNSTTNFNNNNNINSYRKQQFQQMYNAATFEQTERFSEPIQRRILNKPIIQIESSPSIPINNVESNCSNSSSIPSTTSSTFKILHVTKKRFDDSDDESECSCRKVSLSLDDDCPLPRQHHYLAYSSSR